MKRYAVAYWFKGKRMGIWSCHYTQFGALLNRRLYQQMAGDPPVREMCWLVEKDGSII